MFITMISSHLQSSRRARPPEWQPSPISTCRASFTTFNFPTTTSLSNPSSPLLSIATDLPIRPHVDVDEVFQNLTLLKSKSSSFSSNTASRMAALLSISISTSTRSFSILHARLNSKKSHLSFRKNCKNDQCWTCQRQNVRPCISQPSFVWGRSWIYTGVYRHFRPFNLWSNFVGRLDFLFDYGPMLKCWFRRLTES